MEQAYAEASCKRKKTVMITALKIVLVVIVVLIMLSTILLAWFAIIGVVAAGALIWYWPRFDVMWEYVYCDGQLDFDQILGGEKRKTVLRIEIEDADVIAPIGSERLDGYRHIPVKNYTSLEKDANVYGVAVRIGKNDEKTLIMFEPSEKMIDLMHSKCPRTVEKAVS
ncbi:MAG TPA: hypothetical protein DCP06_00060 [Lachnospiraceae bacterium]|nr:hypothetical protein [Lachnospiraceae bacterium]